MRTPSNLSRGSVGFNMTPMIDVVFLLIIFFLVSSHLAQREIQQELDLPDASTSHRAEQDNSRRIVVNVLGEDRILVGTEMMGGDRLTDLIRYESQQSQRELEIRIRANRHVPYRVFEPILAACARNGVWNVTFAVVPSE